MIHDDKPSLDELMHHGVKGQKWGVRKRKPNSLEIDAARVSVRRSASAAATARTASRNATRSNSKTADVKKKEAKQLMLKHLNNPDRVTAAYMTNGEKVAMGILGIGLTGGTVPVAYAVGNKIGRDTIRRRQQAGYYRRQIR